MSDIPSSAGRMYRTMSGYSLADAEALLPTARRGSEQVGPVGGKRSFTGALLPPVVNGHWLVEKHTHRWDT